MYIVESIKSEIVFQLDWRRIWAVSNEPTGQRR